MALRAAACVKKCERVLLREKPDCTADRAEKFVRFFMRGEKQDCAAACIEKGRKCLVFKLF